ncbi:4-diphosphocytidyl-2-C-methyl-D-erythritol kinase [Novosphingobium hassiacum]|uniref:4-diphosphocytidyl-2-C-methyl-D-erythritol kinase n=1 Tax=Novosphingobium hassiacum TaxID=173676 RepID=A0A7W5ZYZ7_9SPHN|nr:4-(cytidine 5'-diphospho)-2-C-methyl-D-erythritol kinase [Novosphingobium hassiacum]MBB3860265.1 4-diphosphocytidyl-2-C-methyl-D-erythritol kinase [Novosphingobium hassiacum]
MRETAYAKINLALHVRRRRDDGYHDLETVFAFVDAGDELTARAAERDSLRVMGEFGSALDNPFGNIVAKALASLPHGPGWAVTLEKTLPVAAGLGGGSADAGAIFRMVEAQFGLPDNWREKAAKLGADVPACVESRACIGRGTGTELEQVSNDLAGSPVLLVNPRVPLATGPVFQGWDGKDRGPLEGDNVREMTLDGRNDLEPSALSLVPQIADVLAALRSTGAWVTRMSGSGATCFALYDSPDQRDGARAAMAPGWWTLAGVLR